MINKYNYPQTAEAAEKAVENMIARLDMSGMNPNTKGTIKQFLQKNTEYAVEEFRFILHAVIVDLESREKKVEQRLDFLKDAEKIVKQAEELREKHPDPRARYAMTIYHEIVDVFVKNTPGLRRSDGTIEVYQRIDDEQAYRNAILAAGRIVAAYLGSTENTDTEK